MEFMCWYFSNFFNPTVFMERYVSVFSSDQRRLHSWLAFPDGIQTLAVVRRNKLLAYGAWIDRIRQGNPRESVERLLSRV